MPYIIRELHVMTQGTRTVKIEHVTHKRGGFSGPPRPEDCYYGVQGTDSADTGWVWLPPGFDTCEAAIDAAETWLAQGESQADFARDERPR